MEEVFDELEDLASGLVVRGSPRQGAHPVLVDVQVVPGEHLQRNFEEREKKEDKDADLPDDLDGN